MTWTYRVVRDEDGGHRIAEVYGDPNDRPSWTADPIYPWGDCVDGLWRDLAKMFKAFDKPVLDEATLRETATRQTDEG